MSITSIPSSRVGRKPVQIPASVQIKHDDAVLTIKGPKGQLLVDVHPSVDLTIESDSISVKPNEDAMKAITGPGNKLYRSIVGTVRANIYNSIYGVSEGYTKKLQLVGVGYRATLKGNMLGLALGFSHPTDFPIPAGITIETPTQTEIHIKGVCKKTVGLVAAKIRAMRPPEPYKGKGVRYLGEHIEIKETKKK